ncbi:MAG: hypothetical protein AABN34_12155 [Acidobacteriota bacterium]
MSDSEQDYGSTLLKRINSTPVSKEEIFEVLTEIHELDEEERDWEGRAITIIRLHSEEPGKAESLQFRIEALARLITNEGTSGWTLPLPNGAVATQHSVFSAAGVEPLIKKDGQLEFDRERFFEKALEFEDVDVIG